MYIMDFYHNSLVSHVVVELLHSDYAMNYFGKVLHAARHIVLI